MDGLFFVNKDIGMTSRQVGAILGKKFNTKKVGHLGTLDPFASGLLIIAMGKATKALAYFKDSIKEYIATISLGVATDSLDNTGKVIKEETIKVFPLIKENPINYVAIFATIFLGRPFTLFWAKDLILVLIKKINISLLHCMLIFL